MNLKKLYVGQEVKNYKAMCELLGEKIKKGNPRKYQLLDWERYFKWEKKGHKFIIKEIYEQPKEKTLQRGGSRDIVPYVQNIEKIILNLLAHANDNKVLLPKNVLYILLHLVNKNYSKYSFNTEELSKQTNINHDDIKEFYQSTNNMLKNNVNRALNNLKRKKMIFWGLELTVKVKEDNYSDYIYRIATDEEYEFILQTENKILNAMGFTEEWQVIYHDKWDEYREKVNEILSQKNIKFSYESYRIHLNREKINEEWLKLKEEEKILELDAINKGVIERTLMLADGRHTKAKREIEKIWGETIDKTIKRRTDENYMINYEKLVDLLIKV